MYSSAQRWPRTTIVSEPLTVTVPASARPGAARATPTRRNPGYRAPKCLVIMLSLLGRHAAKAAVTRRSRSRNCSEIQLFPASVTWMSQSRHQFVNDECFHAFGDHSGRRAMTFARQKRRSNAARHRAARPSRPGSCWRARRCGTAPPSGCCRSRGVRRGRDRPDPGVHRQGSGAALLQRGRPRTR